MTQGAPVLPRPCRDDCGTNVLLARRQPGGGWDVFEATDRNPTSIAAVGCWVLVGAQAWRPHELVEHIHVTQEISAESARDLVNGYPWHRLHRCRSTGGDPSDSDHD